jgi:hypothetical protein
MAKLEWLIVIFDTLGLEASGGAAIPRPLPSGRESPADRLCHRRQGGAQHPDHRHA